MIPPCELDAVVGDSEPTEEVESIRPRPFSSTVGVWRVRSAGGTAVLKLIRLGAAPLPRWPSDPDPAGGRYRSGGWDGYAAGLSDGGFDGDVEAIRWAFFAARHCASMARPG